MTAEDERGVRSMYVLVTVLEVLGVVLIVAALGWLFGAAWAVLATGVAVFGFGVALELEVTR